MEHYRRLRTMGTRDLPQQLGRYILTEYIGKGGMAEIFRAKLVGALGFEKSFVVKRILPRYAQDRDFIAMLVTEARLVCHLDHPNIVAVHELGEVEGQYFIAMEQVDGVDARLLMRTLRQRGMRLPPPLAVHIVSEFLRGLDFAHRAVRPDGTLVGVVHRDISPSNVLVSWRGDVKLSDFGIAHVKQESKSHSGVLRGKYGYLAPEQVAGLPVDQRCDLFAAGIVLAELLLGERLFHGASEFETMLNVMNVRLGVLEAQERSLPPGIVTILRRALQRDPAARHTSAGQLQQALADWLYTQGLRVSNETLAAYLAEEVAPHLPPPAPPEEEPELRDPLPTPASPPPPPLRDSRPLAAELLPAAQLADGKSEYVDDERTEQQPAPPLRAVPSDLPPTEELSSTRPRGRPAVEVVHGIEQLSIAPGHAAYEPPPYEHPPDAITLDEDSALQLASMVIAGPQAAGHAVRAGDEEDTDLELTPLRASGDAVLAGRPAFEMPAVDEESSLRLAAPPPKAPLVAKESIELALPPPKAPRFELELPAVEEEESLKLELPTPATGLARTGPAPAGSKAVEPPRPRPRREIVEVDQPWLASFLASGQLGEEATWTASAAARSWELTKTTAARVLLELLAARAAGLLVLRGPAFTGKLARSLETVARIQREYAAATDWTPEESRLCLVELEAGEATLANADRSEETLLAYLSRVGVMSESQLGAALMRSPQLKPIAAVLAAGLIVPLQLSRHVTSFVTFSLLETFGWLRGEAAFYPGLRCPTGAFPTGYRSVPLVTKGISHLEEPALDELLRRHGQRRLAAVPRPPLRLDDPSLALIREAFATPRPLEQGLAPLLARGDRLRLKQGLHLLLEAGVLVAR